MSDAAIDRAVLSRLKEDLGDDGYEIVLATFIDDTPTLLNEIRSGLAASDAKLVHRAAHTLRSTCAMLGVMALASLSGEIEKLAKADLLANAAALFASADELFAVARAALLA